MSTGDLAEIGVDEGGEHPKQVVSGQAHSGISSAMSKRDWNKRFAHFITGWPAKYLDQLTWWTIARFVTSVLITLLFVGWATYLAVSTYEYTQALRLERIERYRQELQQADDRRNDAARRIGEECAVSTAPIEAVTGCIASRINAYEKQRDSSIEAEAQQEMAFWAEWTFLATATGIVISFFGLILLLWSLSQTRLAISTDREVGHAQVRAYLSFKIAPPANIGPGRIPKTSFKIINTGQSPAYKVRYMAFIDIFEHPMLDWQGSLIEEIPDERKPVINVPANGDVNGDAEHHADLVLTEEMFQTVSNNGPQRIYLVGKVLYEDVFGAEHITELTAFLDIQFRNLEGGKIIGRLDWILSHVRNDAT